MQTSAQEIMMSDNYGQADRALGGFIQGEVDQEVRGLHNRFATEERKVGPQDLAEVKADMDLPENAARAEGLKRVDGKGGSISSGMMVTNGTAYGVFIGRNPKGGTVLVQWAKGGILNLVALEKLRSRWL